MSGLNIGTLTGFLRADDSGMRRGLSDGELRMRGFQRDMEGRIRHLDGRFATLGEQIAAGLRTGSDEGRRFSFSLGRIISVAGGLGGVAASFVRIGLLIGAAVPLAAGLAAAIANIAPAAALAATGIIAMQLATQTLKIGMIGVKEAITAALDPSKAEEFDEALKKLAPNARAFALEVKKLSPEFKKLQQDVQNRMFKDFDRLVQDLAKYTLPHVRKGLKETAAALNAMGLSAGNAGVRMGKNGTLGEAITGATAGLKNLSRIPGQVVTGLIQIGAAAAPAFDRVTKAAGKAFDRLAEGIQSAFDSGALTEAIDAAIDNIKQLGRIGGNILSGLGNIIKGVSVDGQGLFGTLEKITQAFEDLTASKEFQSALKELSKTVGQLVDSALPLLKEAFKAILPVIENIAPPIRDLIKSVGEKLKPVIEKLAPVLEKLSEAFAELIPIVEPFIDLALELAAEALPALTPLFETLRDVFKELQPVAAELAKNIGEQLKPILEKLPEILERLLPHFVDMAERLFPLLVDLLKEIGPDLGELAKAFSDLLIELTPLLVKFLEFQIFLIDKMLPIIKPLVQGLGMSLVGALRLLTDFIRQFVIPAVRTIVALLSGDWRGAMISAATFTNNLRDTASRAFESLKVRGTQAMAQLASDVIGRAQRMATGVAMAVARLVNDAVGWLRSLPGRAYAAVGNLGLLLYASGQSLINGFVRGILSKIAEVRNAASSVVSAARDFFPFSPAKKGPFAGRGWTLYSGQAIAQALAAGMASGQGAVASAAGSLLAGAHPGAGLGLAGGAAGGTGGRGGGTTTVRIVVDGPEPVRRLIRAIVQDGGGDVQDVFGM